MLYFFKDGLTASDTAWFPPLKQENLGNNWVLKFNYLKKLVKLISSYFDEIIGKHYESLQRINLMAISKDSDPSEICKLALMVLVMAVQSPRNKVFIDKIQTMSQNDQHLLMMCIEDTISNDGDESSSPVG